MIRIHTLGRFHVDVDDTPLCFGRKTPYKVLHLLQVLLCERRRGLRRQTLCEALWPDDPLSSAAATLATTLHRLRRLLRAPQAVTVDDGRLLLDSQQCWVDAWQFEQAVDASRDLPGLFDAFELYRGPFLAAGDQPLVVEMRERLRRQFIRTTVELCQLYERAGEADVAVDFYRDALDREPQAESLHRALIACLTRAGCTTEAAEAYERYGSLFARPTGALSGAGMLPYRRGAEL